MTNTAFLFPGEVLADINRSFTPESAVFALNGNGMIYEGLQMENSND